MAKYKKYITNVRIRLLACGIINIIKSLKTIMKLIIFFIEINSNAWYNRK